MRPAELDPVDHAEPAFILFTRGDDLLCVQSRLVRIVQSVPDTVEITVVGHGYGVKALRRGRGHEVADRLLAVHRQEGVGVEVSVYHNFLC